MMTRHDSNEAWLHRWGVLKRGKFLLGSGQTSDIYIDLRHALSDGSRLNAIARIFKSMLLDARPRVGFDIVHGVGYGGIPLAAAIAAEGAPRTAGFSYSRKEPKTHGDPGRTEAHALMNGADVNGRKVLVVDDVLNTGDSVARDIDTIGWLGGNVTAVAVAVDRSDGGIAAELAGLARPVRVLSLCTLADILDYDAKFPSSSG